MDYIKNRLEPQMKYYSQKCASLQKEYYALSIISIVVNAIIPIFTIAIDNFFIIKYIIAILSAILSFRDLFNVIKPEKR